jgi:misacylated tRNA(Ala) deacylase
MPASDPRQHSAEHILTAVFGQLFHGKLLDTRFKGTKVRCDFKLESGLPLEEIIKQTETKANQIIAQNLDVTFEQMTAGEAAAYCSLHRLPEGAENVRLVRIGPEVVTPCSGPHVKNTSEIGRLHIRTWNRVEPGLIRLTFVVE